MRELRCIPCDAKRPEPRIVCCIVTRTGREPYLRKTLKSLRRGGPVDTLLWCNGPVEDDVKQGHLRVWEQPFNCGQHIAHNEMLDECVRLEADFHIRIDDDCWMSTSNWQYRLIRSAEDISADPSWPRVCMGIDIQGLNNPPIGGQKYFFSKSKRGCGTKVEVVDIIGGIFRMTPLPMIKYFRWDERLPMGGGEARQFANYCGSVDMDMVRVLDVHATHGESTLRQEVKDRKWANEHDMLQYVPFGL